MTATPVNSRILYHSFCETSHPTQFVCHQARNAMYCILPISEVAMVSFRSRAMLLLGNCALPIPQYTACQALKGSLSLLLQLTATLLSFQGITQKTLAAASCSFWLRKRKDRWVAALKKFLF